MQQAYGITREHHGRGMKRHAFALIALFLAAAVAPSTALTQNYPARSVRIIVPVAAGGNLDLVIRSIAQKLGDQMGQPVVVENRLGGNGSIGSLAVAKAPADGYMLLAQSNTFVATPAVVKSTPYDPVREFACVGVFAWIPQILVVHPSVPAGSVRELIALAKRRPGELSYGTGANGGIGHITSELFSKEAGIRMIQVPYKGNAPALTDVVGGQISLMFDTISTSIQYVKTGRLKALGVTSPRPSPIFPNLPTIGETLPGYEAYVFNALFAPAGTPRPILERLHDEVSRAVALPELRNRFLEQGVELSMSPSPDQCATFIKAEAEKYARIVREAGIRGD